jgi:hypothetical protein
MENQRSLQHKATCKITALLFFFLFFLIMAPLHTTRKVKQILSCLSFCTVLLE